jgi:hypothetical protein
VLEFQLVFWKRNEEQQKNIPFSVWDVPKRKLKKVRKIFLKENHL